MTTPIIWSPSDTRLIRCDELQAFRLRRRPVTLVLLTNQQALIAHRYLNPDDWTPPRGGAPAMPAPASRAA